MSQSAISKCEHSIRLRPVIWCMVLMFFVSPGILFSGEIVPAEGPDGALYCVEGSTLHAFRPVGRLLWSYHADQPIRSSPMVTPGGDICIVSGNNIITALTPDGAVDWRVETAGLIAPSLAIGGDGSIYYCGIHRYGYITPDGTVGWTGAFGSTGCIVYEPVPPVIAPGGMVYVYDNTLGDFYALDEWGVVRWKHHTDIIAVSQVAVDYRGRLYLLARDRLAALAQSGAVRWQCPLPEGDYSAGPLIGESGDLHAIDAHGIWYTISGSGTLLKTQRTGVSSPCSAFLGADGLRYLCSSTGELYAIDQYGAVTLIEDVAAEKTTGCMITSGRRFCFGSSSGTLISRTAPSASYREHAPWPCAGVNNRHTNHVGQPAHLGTILGTATIGSTGTPATGAVITVTPGNTTVTADSYGVFTITGLAAGSYELSTEGFGVLPSPSQTVSVSAGETAICAFELARDRKWLQWTYPSDAALRTTPVIGSDGTLYIATDDGDIRAIAPDGTGRWRFETGAAVTPLSIVDETVLFGAGTTIWRLAFDGTVVSSITAPKNLRTVCAGHDGTLVTIDEQGTLSILDGDGAVLGVSAIPAGHGLPLIGPDGTIYVASAENALAAIDRYGETKWINPLGVAGQPAMDATGVLYCSASDGVHAIKPSGNELWHITIDGLGPLYTGPVIDGNGWIIVATKEAICALSEGRLLWRYDIPVSPSSSLAVGADGVIYVGLSDRTICALTGEGYLTWRYQSWGTPRRGIAIAGDGSMYVPTSSGELLAFRTRSYGYPPDAVWPREGRDNGNTSRINPSAHATRLSGTITDRSTGEAVIGAEVVAQPGNYSASTDSRGWYEIFIEQPGVYQINVTVSGWEPVYRTDIIVDAGRPVTEDFALGHEAYYLKWKTYVGQTEESVFKKTIAISDEGCILFQRSAQLLCLNPDGSNAWAWDIPEGSGGYGSPVIGNTGDIYFSDRSNFYAIEPEGRERWRFETGGARPMTCAVGTDNSIYLTSGEDFWLWSLSSAGETNWELHLSQGTYTQPVIGDNSRIYTFGRNYGLYVINPDGTRYWDYPVGMGMPFVQSAMDQDGAMYFFHGGTPKLFCIKPDGTVKWYRYIHGNSRGSIIVGPDNSMYLTFDRSLMAFDRDGEQKLLYQNCAPDATPVLGDNETLYVAAENRIIALGTDGTFKWSYQLGGTPVYEPKLTPGGVLIVYCADGFVYAIQTESNGYPDTPCWPCMYGNNRNTNRIISDVVPAVEEQDGSTPEAVSLTPNAPNPFNSATTLSYAIPRDSRVTLAVYSVTGQKIATLVDDTLDAGTYHAVFDGAGLASGIYFARLDAGGMVQTRKMLLVK